MSSEVQEDLEGLQNALLNTDSLRDLAASIVTRVSGKPPQPASPFEKDD